MNEILANFLKFLTEEYNYLEKIKQFLLGAPGMITTGEINKQEFRDFMEKYELETARFLFEKKQFKESLAKQLNISTEQLTFKLLVDLGHREFAGISVKVLKINKEISLLLLKVSIYLANFSKLHNEFQRLNNFLYRNDYNSTARGAGFADQVYNYTPGSNFYGEA